MSTLCSVMLLWPKDRQEFGGPESWAGLSWCEVDCTDGLTANYLINKGSGRLSDVVSFKMLWWGLKYV